MSKLNSYNNYFTSEIAMNKFNNLQSSDVFLQALNFFNEPIIIVDSETNVLYFNSSYASYFKNDLKRIGISIKELLNMKLKNFNSDITPILKTIEDHQPRSKCIKYILESEHSTVIYNTIPLKVNNELLGVMIIMDDTINIKRLNDQIHNYKNCIRQLQNEVNNNNLLPDSFLDIIGSSPNFMHVLNTAVQVAKSNISICLQGESGTGKEVLSKAIHYASSYSEGPFIPLNCAAIPESLMESELFGYEDGAFTDARSGGNPGKFELANNGTIFLDEIGDMPVSMQVKLLRVLQEKEVTRIGSTKPVSLNFRLIVATNKNLKKMISEGLFREDLYYRINVVPLILPPLRNRTVDIIPLANSFLKVLNTKYGLEKTFAPETTDYLKSYFWPGNIRELKNCIERIAILSSESLIDPTILPPYILDKSASLSSLDIKKYKLKSIIEKVEKEAIGTALTQVNGNRTKAIELLGISKRSFYQKIQKYNIL